MLLFNKENVNNFDVKFSVNKASLVFFFFFPLLLSLAAMTLFTPVIYIHLGNQITSGQAKIHSSYLAL